MKLGTTSFQLFARLALRQARDRPSRVILTILSVVIAVAGVVAVTTATDATEQAYRDMYAAISGRADIEVISERGGTCPESLAADIERLSGVRLAAPVIQRPTAMYFGELRIGTMVMGVDPRRNRQLHDLELVAGQTLEQADGALLEVAIAKDAGIQVGDQIRIYTRSGIRRIDVVGLISTRSVSTVAQGGMLWMRVERAQGFYRLGDRVDALQVILDEGADEEVVRREIAKLLPPGIMVRRPELRSESVEDRILSAQLGLNVGCACTLLAAAFIIFNTFLMNITERRRQFGILRAVGATTRQVTWLLLCEALLLGAAGTVCGLAIGLAGAWGLMRAMEDFFDTALPSLPVSSTSLLLGAAAGFGISLLAAFLPARWASRTSPVESMRPISSEHADDGSRAMVRVGMALIVLGALGRGWTLVADTPTWIAIGSGLMIQVGLILIIPALMPLLLRVAVSIVGRFWSVESRIAVGQLRSWRARTALTIGVVNVVLSTGIGLGNTILCNISDVQTWLQHTLSADFFVYAAEGDLVTGTSTDMPEEIRQQIAKIDGVELVDPVRYVRSAANGKSALVVTRDFELYRQLPFDIQQGDPDAIARGLKRGDVVLGSVLARRIGLKAGDELELNTEQGPKQLRVAGIVTDYQVGGMVLYMDRHAAQRIMAVEGADMFLVKARQGTLSQVEGALNGFCQRHGLLLQSFAGVVQSVDRLIGGAVAGLWVILWLETIVAAIGIANTLTMNVLQQTREIGLLRIVGMTRSQVRKTIFSQALLIGLSAICLGLPGGLLVAWLMNHSAQTITGNAAEFVIHGWLFAGAAVMTMAIVFLSAWLPAERAVGLRPAEALAYE
jgi:putative ABC transport system permease protein